MVSNVEVLRSQLLSDAAYAASCATWLYANDLNPRAKGLEWIINVVKEALAYISFIPWCLNYSSRQPIQAKIKEVINSASNIEIYSKLEALGYEFPILVRRQ